MTTLSSDATLKLRQPPVAFVALALAIMFVIALLLFNGAAALFSGPSLISLQILTIPSALGAGLAAVSVWRARKRAVPMSRRQLVLRGGVAMAAAGFAWPLSFGILALLQGDAHGAMLGLRPALLGLAVGMSAGALGGFAVSYASYERG